MNFENRELRLRSPPAFFTILLLISARFTDASGTVGNGHLRHLQDDELVSCSPSVLKIVLSLNQMCGDGDLIDNEGIEDTLCLLDVDFTGGENDDLFPGRILNRRLDWKPASNRALQEETTDTVPVEISSIQFLELDSFGNLDVINQDTSFTDVSLEDGDEVQFNSISVTLDPTVPLEEQLAILPGGGALIIVGTNAAGETLRNRILWTYTNSCESSCMESDVPITEGDTIGWVTFSGPPEDRGARCPKPPTASPIETPTTSPPTVSSTTSPPIQTPVEGVTLAPAISERPTPPVMSMAFAFTKMGKTEKTSKEILNLIDFSGKTGKEGKMGKTTKHGKEGDTRRSTDARNDRRLPESNKIEGGGKDDHVVFGRKPPRRGKFRHRL